MKKLLFISLTFLGVSVISGCASSSFNEYFNEPIPIVEKSVTPHTIYHSNIPEDKKEESTVQTFPVEDIR